MLPATRNGLSYTLRMLFVMTCLIAGASAQGLTGQISGSLADPQGGAVSNAKVEVINEETAQSRIVTSDAAGNFVVTQLLPGAYSLVVTADGFKKFEQKGIIVPANERVVVRKATLEVGDVSQTVTVTAEAPNVQTESASAKSKSC